MLMMKYVTRILPLVLLLAFSGCKKEDSDTGVPDTPVSVERFLVNLTAFTNFNAVLKIKRSDSFQINYNLKDDGIIKNHALYFLVNNDPDLKYYLFYPTIPETSDMSYGFVFSDLEQFYLDSQEFYDTRVGDQLHFFLLAEDDTGNKTERTFVVELE